MSPLVNYLPDFLIIYFVEHLSAIHTSLHLLFHHVKWQIHINHFSELKSSFLPIIILSLLLPNNNKYDQLEGALANYLLVDTANSHV